MSELIPIKEDLFHADPRVQWIRQRTLLALNIPSETFDAYFKDSIERARSSGAAREQLSAFMSTQFSAGAALFFSSHQWIDDVEVEEDVEVQVDPEEEAGTVENIDPNVEGADVQTLATLPVATLEGEGPIATVEENVVGVLKEPTKKTIKVTLHSSIRRWLPIPSPQQPIPSLQQHAS